MKNQSNNPGNAKYSQIAGNRLLDAMIRRCFEYLCEEDVRKFIKKFRQQRHESDQIMHTFRGLILGAYLSGNGLGVRHEHGLNGKTPDWCILNDESEVTGICELVNFHIDQATENQIR